MRSLKSGLFAFMLTGVLGAAAVVGCSASGDGVGIDTTQTPTEPDPASTGSTLPPKGTDPAPSTDGGKDAGKKDAAPKPEAGVDAGPPPPVPGTACTDTTVTGKKPCGACGHAEALCQDDGTGKLKWTDYGACGAELAGGCVPGTTVTEACGNCGTQVKTCTQYCAYSVSACTGQPVNNCKPGAVEYTTASCATPSTYKNRVCAGTCTWAPYSATCETPTTPNKMTVSAAVGGVVSAEWTLAGNQKRPSGTCPATITASSSTGPFAVVEVSNPSATKVAEVTIYQSQSATGKANLDLVLWTYAGNGLPMNDMALGACVDGVEDYCLGSSSDLATNPCGNTGSNFYFAGIDKISIPAGGKILVYSSTFGSGTTIGDGTFKLNLKTTKLQ